MRRKVTVLFLCSHKEQQFTEKPEVPDFRLVARPCPECAGAPAPREETQEEIAARIIKEVFGG